MNALARLDVLWMYYNINFVATGNAFCPLALMMQYRVRHTESHLWLQYVVVLFNCTPFFVIPDHSSITCVNVVSLSREIDVVRI